MSAEPLDSHFTSVLIVDDEPDICLVLQDLLRHEGYTVRSVMTGREALHEAEQSQFGAVILDLGLPDLSGFAVLRGLEELDPLLPVIVLTASTQDSHTVEALRRAPWPTSLSPITRRRSKSFSVKPLMHGDWRSRCIVPSVLWERVKSSFDMFSKLHRTGLCSLMTMAR